MYYAPRKGADARAVHADSGYGLAHIAGIGGSVAVLKLGRKETGAGVWRPSRAWWGTLMSSITHELMHQFCRQFLV